jgi:acetyltransferase
MVERVKKHVPHAEISGCYVEKMVDSGVELLLGISRDPQFGPCLMVGFGGIWAEVMNDVAIRALPVSRSDVEDMLESLRGHAMLTGVRGVVIDREAVIAAALNLASLATDLGDRLEAIDVNPLLAQANGATVLDCRLQLRA